jgi:hypothetical protein
MILASPGPSCLVEIRAYTAYKAVELPSRVRRQRQAAGGHRDPCTGRHISTGRLHSSCLSHCVARQSHNCVATGLSNPVDVRRGSAAIWSNTGEKSPCQADRQKNIEYDVRPELSILKQRTTAGRNSKRWHLEGRRAQINFLISSSVACQYIAIVNSSLLLVVPSFPFTTLSLPLLKHHTSCLLSRSPRSSLAGWATSLRPPRARWFGASLSPR